MARASALIEGARRLGIRYGHWATQNRFFQLWQARPDARDALLPLAADSRLQSRSGEPGRDRAADRRAPAHRRHREHRARRWTAAAIRSSARSGPSSRSPPTSSRKATTCSSPTCTIAATASAGARRRCATWTTIAGRARSAWTRWAGIVYTIEALTETFRSWLADFEKRDAGGQDLESALGEGLALIRDGGGAGDHRRPTAAPSTPTPTGSSGPRRRRRPWRSPPSRAGRSDGAPSRPGGGDAGRTRARGDRRPRARSVRRLVRALPALRHVALDRSATFKEAEAQLARVAAMGFDVVYLPPIHPIGRAHRKGRNNALVAAAGDPGSPWAIGSADGGYTAVHPDLGTLDDFDRFVESRAPARARGRARLRDPVLAGSSLGPRAPGVVLPPSRRHDQVRREPAEEVPGHLPAEFPGRGSAPALGGDAADPRVLDRPRREHVPRRQSPHEAREVLGVADPRHPGRASRGRSSWPKRSPAPR